MVHKGTQHLSNELLLMMSGTLREVGEVGLPLCARHFPASAEAMTRGSHCVLVLNLS